MTIQSENPLPRYASEQKSVTNGRTDGQRQNNIFPEIFRQGITIIRITKNDNDVVVDA